MNGQVGTGLGSGSKPEKIHELDGNYYLQINGTEGKKTYIPVPAGETKEKIKALFETATSEAIAAQKIQEREEKGEGKQYDIGDGRTLTTYGNQGRRLDIGPEGDARVTLHDVNGHVYKEQTEGEKRTFKELKGEEAAQARIKLAQAGMAAKLQDPDLDRDSFHTSFVRVPGTDGERMPLQWKTESDGTTVFTIAGRDEIFAKSKDGKIYGADGHELSHDTAKSLNAMLNEAKKDNDKTTRKTVKDAEGTEVGTYEDHSKGLKYDTVRLDQDATIGNTTYPPGTYVRTAEGVKYYKDNDLSKEGELYRNDGSPKSKQLNTMFNRAKLGDRASASPGYHITDQGTFTNKRYNGKGDDWVTADVPDGRGGTVKGNFIHVADSKATIESFGRGRKAGDYFVIPGDRHHPAQVYEVHRSPSGKITYNALDKSDPRKQYVETLNRFVTTGDGRVKSGLATSTNSFANPGVDSRNPFSHGDHDLPEARRDGRRFYRFGEGFDGASFDAPTPGEGSLYVPVAATGKGRALAASTSASFVAGSETGGSVFPAAAAKKPEAPKAATLTT